ncbi:MAG TPA: DUF4349 domain-containing protein [Myxococcaceae bacterium]|nr:DUF4349 domain-containing protein [Myxococcaceae bacterium]
MNVPRPSCAALTLLFLVGCAASEPEMVRRDQALTDGKDGQNQTDRAVIKTASMRVLREDPKTGVGAAEAIATKLGGYSSNSSLEAITLMVPSPKLDEALTALGGLGQVDHKEVRARDVTEARADLELRLTNLRKSRERYLEILAKAANVAETLAVEKELERITLEIERLQAALDQTNHLVAMATVDVQFARPVKPGPVGWVFYGVYSAVKWLLVWD